MNKKIIAGVTALFLSISAKAGLTESILKFEIGTNGTSSFSKSVDGLNLPDTLKSKINYGISYAYIAELGPLGLGVDIGVFKPGAVVTDKAEKYLNFSYISLPVRGIVKIPSFIPLINFYANAGVSSDIYKYELDLTSHGQPIKLKTGVAQTLTMGFSTVFTPIPKLNLSFEYRFTETPLVKEVDEFDKEKYSIHNFGLGIAYFM